MHPELIFNDQPTEQEVAEFHRGLRAHNVRFLERALQPFAVTVANREGKIIGGINGESYWGRLHVANLWVWEVFRSQGVGRQLVELAEAIALERRCLGVDLDTMSFHAPGFYEKLGYRRVGVVGNYRGGYQRYYYSKELEVPQP